MPLSLHQKGSDETGLAVSTSILQPGSDTGKLHQSSDEAEGCRINTWTNLTPAVRPAVLHTAALPLCGHTWVLHFCKEQPSEFGSAVKRNIKETEARCSSRMLKTSNYLRIQSRYYELFGLNYLQ